MGYYLQKSLRINQTKIIITYNIGLVNNIMSTENTIKFCPNCGKKTMPNAKFCIECGYEFALLYKNNTINEKSNEETTIEETIPENNKETETTQEDFEIKIPQKQENHAKTLKQENKSNSFDIVRPSSENKPKKHVKKDFNILKQTQPQEKNNTQKESVPVELSHLECPSCGNRMQKSQKSGLLSKNTYHSCNNCLITFRENKEYLVLEKEPEFTRFKSKLHLKKYTPNQWNEILHGNYTPDEVSNITSWHFEETTNISCPACNHQLTKYKTGGLVTHYLVCQYCNLILEEHDNNQYTIFNSTEIYSPLWQYENKPLPTQQLRELFANEPEENKKQREITVQKQELQFREHEKLIKQQQDDMTAFVKSLESGTPMLIPPSDTTIVLKKNERPVYKTCNVALMEPRAVRTSSGGYGGASVRIAKGVTIHSGRTASKSESHDEIKVIDTGDLLITNQRVIFLGHNRTTNIDIKKIIAITSQQDTIQIQRSNKQKAEYFTNVQSTQPVSIDGRDYSIDIDGELLRKLILGFV